MNQSDPLDPNHKPEPAAAVSGGDAQVHSAEAGAAGAENPSGPGKALRPDEGSRGPRRGPRNRRGPRGRRDEQGSSDSALPAQGVPAQPGGEDFAAFSQDAESAAAAPGEGATPGEARRDGQGPRGPRRERGPRFANRGKRPPGPYGAGSPDTDLAPEVDNEPVPQLQVEAPLGLSVDASGKRGRSEASEFDEKLHKVLADAGIGSRREMEELIHAGRISVNGKPAHTGQRVGANDQIRVNGRTLKRKKVALPPQVLLYHKTSSEICTRDDPQQRSTVFDRLPRLKGARWVSVGRLDYNTEGLLVFTTSGDLANKLMHPRYGWEREYAVRVLGRIDEAARERLLQGIQLEDGLAKVNSIAELGGEAANAWYKVCISEGRNREVRRLMEAVGVVVSRLVRVRFGPIALPPGLSRGRWVELGTGDVAELLRLVRKQVMLSEGRDPAEVEALLAASRNRDDDDEDEDLLGAGLEDGQEAFYDDEPIPAYVDAGVVDDTVPDLVGEQAEDDWQPRSANAHLEGISRAVRKGEKGKGGAKSARGPRSRGAFAGAMSVGVSADGRIAGFGSGAGGARKNKRGGAGKPWGDAAGGAWSGGPMGPSGLTTGAPEGGGPRQGRGPRPKGPGKPGAGGPMGQGRRAGPPGKPGQRKGPGGKGGPAGGPAPASGAATGPAGGGRGKPRRGRRGGQGGGGNVGSAPPGGGENH